MIYKFKKHRKTIRPPFNAEDMFPLGTVRMMFWRRRLRQKIVKHKRGSRSRHGQQHAVALAKEKSIPLDKVGFETRLHRRDGVFSDPHPKFARIAAEVRGRAEEMDVVGGVSKKKHICDLGCRSTTRCSISIVGSRVDSSASYRSTGDRGFSVGATSQNSTDVVIEEMQALLELREAQLHEQKKVNVQMMQERVKMFEMFDEQNRIIEEQKKQVQSAIQCVQVQKKHFDVAIQCVQEQKKHFDVAIQYMQEHSMHCRRQEHMIEKNN